MNVGSRARASSQATRFEERASERFRQASRAHGGLILLVAILVALRSIGFVAFSLLISISATLDPTLLRALIIVDGALSVALDIVVVFVAMAVFATVRRIENESDRIQIFMDSVYRRLP